MARDRSLDEFVGGERKTDDSTDGEGATAASDSGDGATDDAVPEDGGESVDADAVPEDGGESVDADAVPEDSMESADADAVPEDSEESVDEAENELTDPAPDDVEPATATYRWEPDGIECSACGTTVNRLWTGESGQVCAECKEW
ncbi:DUF7573 domain-containing protein [Halobellus marinus]|uniref:DUF7573 domain-containing protein n=1 Tax=Halobellus marinus TaxID=3075123 RepID=UPI0028B14929|nr:hypothetical protein [Halobellus sp. DFY28]